MRNILIALLLVAAPSAARAQVVSPYTGGAYFNPPSTLGMTLLNEQMRSAVAQDWYGKGTAKPKKRKTITATDFKGSGRRTVEAEVYRALGANEEQSKGLALIMDATFAAFEKEGRKDNVAYALAALFGVAVQIQSGKEIPDERAEQIALDLNDALAVDARFRKMKAAERQRIYESCLVTVGLMSAFHAVGARKKDPAMEKAAKQLAEQVLAGFRKR